MKLRCGELRRRTKNGVTAAGQAKRLEEGGEKSRGAEVDGMSQRINRGKFLGLCLKKDSEAAVREALEKQPELVNCRDAQLFWHDWTPLHHASFKGHDKVVWALLKYGAEVNAQDSASWTPLHCAATEDHTTTARLLLEYGAEADLRNDDGDTARDVAVQAGKKKVVEVIDTYVSVAVQLEQVLLGLRGREESPLTRFAGHSAFEPNVLLLVKCLLTGEPNLVFEQLQSDVQSDACLPGAG